MTQAASNKGAAPRPLPPQLACHHCGRRASVILKSVKMCGGCFLRESQRKKDAESFEHAYTAEGAAESNIFYVNESRNASR